MILAAAASITERPRLYRRSCGIMACACYRRARWQPIYSATAIETSLALRLVFHQPLHQALSAFERARHDMLGPGNLPFKQP
jgi:hypothetical protein